MLGWSILTAMLVSGTILLCLWVSSRFAGVLMLLAMTSWSAVMVSMAPHVVVADLATFIFFYLGVAVGLAGWLLVLNDIAKDTVRDIGGNAVGWGLYYAIIPVSLLLSVWAASYCLLMAPLVGLVGIIIFSTVTHFLLEVYTAQKM